MELGQAATKRFYKHAGTEFVEGGILLQLDGRPLKTPLGRPLIVPSHALANALAAEWEAQGDDIRPDTMPLSQLAVTAKDRMDKDRAEVVASLVAFGTTDLLCYRADNPADLVKRQADVWQPLLDWAADTFGARLMVTAGVLPVEQPMEALSALRDAVTALGAFELAVLGSITPASGSLILGLALLAGRLDADGVVAAAFVDETYQAELWGEDDEATARRRVLEADIRNAAAFLLLLDQD